ncbi:MAG: aldolase catalytic domain-containing protein [Endomicrobiales bacterium]|jgi:4-hydroxy 2-oxovalerate aldolase
MNQNNNKNTDPHTYGTVVGFRPDVKVLDCTIRDGGLINSHHFDDAFVKAVYDTCVASGIHYMELGYKGSKKIFSPTQYGPWKFCDEDDIRRIVGENKTDTKLSVMVDAERTDYHTDILPKDKSVIDCVRVATYIHQIPTAIDMIKDAADKGYETAVNLMAVSIVSENDLNDALELFVKSPVNTIYLVDSFGSFFPKQVREMITTFREAVKGTDKQIGMHAHNNQQLAYANTIDALIYGASLLDVTINGMGRGAGNCPMELLLGFLKNPRFDLRPVLESIENVFVPLRQKLKWGYTIAYMISGQLNQHPRAAIEFVEGAHPDNILAFYDRMIQEES